MKSIIIAALMLGIIAIFLLYNFEKRGIVHESPHNRVLVIGDSFVEGAGAPKGQGWAYLLPGLFPNLNFDIRGVGGDTTENILSRFPSKDYDYYIIQIGTNDSRYRPSRKEKEIPEKRFKENLFRILSKTKNNAHVYFVGLFFVDETKTTPYKKDHYYTNTSLHEYDYMIEKFCESNKISYISLKEMNGFKYYLSDGLHPSSEGYKEIAHIIANHLGSKS